MTKRLESVNVGLTPENRILFRETLFSSKSMVDCIGGVILYDETIKQITKSGKSVPEFLDTKNTITGIKVDIGAKPMVVKMKNNRGIRWIKRKIKKYNELGAKFTKWRGL